MAHKVRTAALLSAKAVWLSGYSGRHRTERFWVQTLHMLPPLVSQGDVGLPTLSQGEGRCVVKLNIMGIPMRLQTLQLSPAHCQVYILVPVIIGKFHQCRGHHMDRAESHLFNKKGFENHSVVYKIYGL